MEISQEGQAIPVFGLESKFLGQTWVLIIQRIFCLVSNPDFFSQNLLLYAWMYQNSLWTALRVTKILH